MGQLFINPYINFGGRGQEAFKFYQKVLGGELDMQAFVEGGAPKPAEPGDKIMHGRLESDSAIIMGTDGMEDAPNVGDNISIALGGSDAERLHQIFDGLSEGGTVTSPLKKESWGDEFGMFTDKFGIHWMVNISAS